MRYRLEQFMMGLFIVFLATGSLTAQTSTASSGVGPTLQYLSPMSFGPDAVLFAADAQEVFIYALDLSEHVVGGVAGTQSVPDIDKKIADLLGTTTGNIVLTDLAVYPNTGNTFISLMRGSDPVLLRVDGSADITVVPLDQVSYTRIGLPNPPGETTDMLLKGGRGMPIPNYPSNQVAEYPMNLFGVQTITDLAYVDGRLYAAGLSNEEFASKLRSIAYPFTSVDEGTSVEIWHAPHDQFETRSPIYTFVPYEINDEPHLIASYLCTPLVKFPISSLQPGADVRGETIAEFGSGNRPLDMIVYQKNGQDYLLMSNNRHGVMKIPTQDFGSTENLTGIVPDGATAGVPFEKIDALQGVEQLDRLDMDHAIVLIRSDTDVLRLEVVDLP
tara:strand:- start:31007 stop:32167 length:1161 start_codon:yes stop_codon:yes gene_type:complete